MRLLHTSDWHLGRRLHRDDLREAQAAFLAHLVETVRSERVDTVLVSGDVYDRAVPPLDAVALAEEALWQLRDAGARVVLISGNHDSATRLGFSSRLLDSAGVHLRTRVAGCAAPVLLEDEHGPVSVYAVPYLEPATAAPDLGADLPRTQAAVLGHALQACAADLAERGGRSVALAHAWVAGGDTSESERDISTVGGVGTVPAALFAPFDYGALGHLHGPQVLGDGSVRYSGSPLAYSFSEARHTKGSWLVELDASGLARVEAVPAPVPRRMSLLRGRLEELLTSREHDALEQDWLSVVLTDPVRPDAAMDRLSARFPHVLVLQHEPEGVERDTRSYGARVAGRSDLEVAAGFVAHVRGTPAEQAEEQLLADALEAGRLAAVSA